MTEDEILTSKPFSPTAEQRPPLQSLGIELVDAIMHRLSTFTEFRDAMERIPEERKNEIDVAIMSEAMNRLQCSGLSVPGSPLEPEGKVFEVQVGGSLLLSGQKP